jgi:hypothetical protein
VKKQKINLGVGIYIQRSDEKKENKAPFLKDAFFVFCVKPLSDRWVLQKNSFRYSTVVHFIGFKTHRAYRLQLFS